MYHARQLLRQNSVAIRSHAGLRSLPPSQSTDNDGTSPAAKDRILVHRTPSLPDSIRSATQEDATEADYDPEPAQLTMQDLKLAVDRLARRTGVSGSIWSQPEPSSPSHSGRRGSLGGYDPQPAHLTMQDLKVAIDRLAKRSDYVGSVWGDQEMSYEV